MSVNVRLHKPEAEAGLEEAHRLLSVCSLLWQRAGCSCRAQSQYNILDFQRGRKPESPGSRSKGPEPDGVWKLARILPTNFAF